MASFLLGPTLAQRLYQVTPSHMILHQSALRSTPFIQRLRAVLQHCCATLGTDAASEKLQLPKAIAEALAVSTVSNTKYVDVGASEGAEEKREAEVVLNVTEEQKRAILNMYLKGVKVEYIAGLFNILNSKVIHSWGDWQKRPKFEAERNIEKREQIHSLLRAGENVKTVKYLLKLKETLYREQMGIAVGAAFTTNDYGAVMQQMATHNSRTLAIRNTRVPGYMIKRWTEGKSVPLKPVLESDAEASVDIKKLAIARFYETGNALSAAKSAGVAQPQVVERWVVKYQQAVDEQERGKESEVE